MIDSIHKKQSSLSYKILCGFTALTFLTGAILPPQAAWAQAGTALLNLPVPGTMVPPSRGFIPAIMTGVTVHPDDPLRFDFIIDTGHTDLKGEPLKAESRKLIKYFLAALTVPEDELWVNLSPYEQDRMVAPGLGKTEMGRDMLAQDYLLKQLTASLMYPEEELGKKFWDRVYQKVQEQFGTTEIPVNTFNKVWIVPEEAVVYEQGTSAFVVKSRLRVMLDEDYLAASQGAGYRGQGTEKQLNPEPRTLSPGTEIIREIIIPEIEKEVNEGETFANLRQIYNSLILATWYKQRLKESLLGKVYVNQNKTKGINPDDPAVNQKIYDRYIASFEKGVYNYIKEDVDPATQQVVPRKYFSGGVNTYNPRPGKGWLSRMIAATILTGFLLSGSPAFVQAEVSGALAGVGTKFGVTTQLVENATGNAENTSAIVVHKGPAPAPLLLAGNETSSSPVRIEAPKDVPAELAERASLIYYGNESKIGEFLGVKQISRIRYEIAQEEDSSGGYVLRFILGTEQGEKSFYAKLRHSYDLTASEKLFKLQRKGEIRIFAADPAGDWIEYRAPTLLKTMLNSTYKRRNPTALEYGYTLKASNEGILPPSTILKAGPEEVLVIQGIDNGISLEDLRKNQQWAKFFLDNEERFVKEIGRQYGRLNKKANIVQYDTKKQHIFITQDKKIFLIDLSTRGDGEVSVFASPWKGGLFIPEVDIRHVTTKLANLPYDLRNLYETPINQKINKYEQWVQEGYDEIEEQTASPSSSPVEMNPETAKRIYDKLVQYIASTKSKKTPVDIVNQRLRTLEAHPGQKGQDISTRVRHILLDEGVEPWARDQIWSLLVSLEDISDKNGLKTERSLTKNRDYADLLPYIYPASVAPAVSAQEARERRRRYESAAIKKTNEELRKLGFGAAQDFDTLYDISMDFPSWLDKHPGMVSGKARAVFFDIREDIIFPISDSLHEPEAVPPTEFEVRRLRTAMIIFANGVALSVYDKLAQEQGIILLVEVMAHGDLKGRRLIAPRGFGGNQDAVKRAIQSGEVVYKHPVEERYYPLYTIKIDETYLDNDEGQPLAEGLLSIPFMDESSGPDIARSLEQGLAKTPETPPASSPVMAGEEAMRQIEEFLKGPRKNEFFSSGLGFFDKEEWIPVAVELLVGLDRKKDDLDTPLDIPIQSSGGFGQITKRRFTTDHNVRLGHNYFDVRGFASTVYQIIREKYRFKADELYQRLLTDESFSDNDLEGFIEVQAKAMVAAELARKDQYKLKSVLTNSNSSFIARNKKEVISLLKEGTFYARTDREKFEKLQHFIVNNGTAGSDFIDATSSEDNPKWALIKKGEELILGFRDKTRPEDLIVFDRLSMEFDWPEKMHDADGNEFLVKDIDYVVRDKKSASSAVTTPKTLQDLIALFRSRLVLNGKEEEYDNLTLGGSQKITPRYSVEGIDFLDGNRGPMIEAVAFVDDVYNDPPGLYYPDPKIILRIRKDATPLEVMEALMKDTNFWSHGQADEMFPWRDLLGVLRQEAGQKKGRQITKESTALVKLDKDTALDKIVQFFNQIQEVDLLSLPVMLPVEFKSKAFFVLAAVASGDVLSVETAYDYVKKNKEKLFHGTFYADMGSEAGLTYMQILAAAQTDKGKRDIVEVLRNFGTIFTTHNARTFYSLAAFYAWKNKSIEEALTEIEEIAEYLVKYGKLWKEENVLLSPGIDMYHPSQDDLDRMGQMAAMTLAIVRSGGIDDFERIMRNIPNPPPTYNKLKSMTARGLYMWIVVEAHGDVALVEQAYSQIQETLKSGKLKGPETGDILNNEEAKLILTLAYIKQQEKSGLLPSGERNSRTEFLEEGPGKLPSREFREDASSPVLTREQARKQVEIFLQGPNGSLLKSKVGSGYFESAKGVAVELLRELHGKSSNYGIYDTSFTKGDITLSSEVILTDLRDEAVRKEVSTFLYVVYGRTIGMFERPNIENVTKSPRPEWVMGRNPEAIVQQEKEGQRQLARSEMLPVDGTKGKESEWSAMGVELGEPVEGDPLFRHVRLPIGWEIVPTDHDMWSNLVDVNGKIRAQIFYKAAFYDRKAYVKFSSSPLAGRTSDPSASLMASEERAARDKVGGIDLNPALLDLQIRRDGNGVPLPLPQQPIETMHIDGFLPVIINIVPIANLPLLLGLADTASDTVEIRPALKAREIEPVSLLN